DGVQNVLNILNMCDSNHVPVYAGESHAMNQSSFDRLEVSARIHGENDVGQVSIETSPRQKEVGSAIDFLIESIKKYKKDLVIVATGPMTNLTLALKKAPEIKEMIGRVVIMGGALTVPGNASPYTKANISQDPEAAKLSRKNLHRAQLIHFSIKRSRRKPQHARLHQFFTQEVT